VDEVEKEVANDVEVQGRVEAEEVDRGVESEAVSDGAL
jgi:hypothetical protein